MNLFSLKCDYFEDLFVWYKTEITNWMSVVIDSLKWIICTVMTKNTRCFPLFSVPGLKSRCRRGESRDWSGYLDPFPTHTHTAPIINIFIEISHGQPDTVYSNWFQLIDHQSMSVLSEGKRHQYFWVYCLVWAHADIGWWKTSLGWTPGALLLIGPFCLVSHSFTLLKFSFPVLSPTWHHRRSRASSF